MSVSFNFTGRAVIVTGAARGIGRVMVERFAAAGARVLAADRDADGLAETCRPLDPAQVASLVADVSTEDGANSIVEAAVARYGRLDVCVNNAAVAPHASLFDRSQPHGSGHSGDVGVVSQHHVADPRRSRVCPNRWSRSAAPTAQRQSVKAESDWM